MNTLQPPQGHRKATVRVPYGSRTVAVRHRTAAVRQQQLFCLHKFNIDRAATVAYVTARVSYRRNAAAAVDILFTVGI